MTQRRRPRRPARRARRRFGRRAFLAGLGVSACAAGAFFLRRGTQAAATPPKHPAPRLQHLIRPSRPGSGGLSGSAISNGQSWISPRKRRFGPGRPSCWTTASPLG